MNELKIFMNKYGLQLHMPVQHFYEEEIEMKPSKLPSLNVYKDLIKMMDMGCELKMTDMDKIKTIYGLPDEYDALKYIFEKYFKLVIYATQTEEGEWEIKGNIGFSTNCHYALRALCREDPEKVGLSKKEVELRKTFGEKEPEKNYEEKMLELIEDFRDRDWRLGITKNIHAELAEITKGAKANFGWVEKVISKDY